MIINEDVRRCFDKICENFSIIADLNISEPIQSRETPEELFLAFVDINACSHFDISGREILLCHVKSTKDYKNLRKLIRKRLISSLRDMQDLIEGSLRNLGAKV